MKRKIKPNELTKEIWIDGKTKFVLDNLYLVGHCYLRDEKRTFRVDRIKGLKISKWLLDWHTIYTHSIHNQSTLWAQSE